MGRAVPQTAVKKRRKSHAKPPRRKDEKRRVSDGQLKLVFRLGRQILDNGLMPWRLGVRFRAPSHSAIRDPHFLPAGGWRLGGTA
jgi:hypothetical protein